MKSTVKNLHDTNNVLYHNNIFISEAYFLISFQMLYKMRLGLDDMNEKRTNFFLDKLDLWYECIFFSPFNYKNDKLQKIFF